MVQMSEHTHSHTCLHILGCYYRPHHHHHHHHHHHRVKCCDCAEALHVLVFFFFFSRSVILSSVCKSPRFLSVCFTTSQLCTFTLLDLVFLPLLLLIQRQSPTLKHREKVASWHVFSAAIGAQLCIQLSFRSAPLLYSQKAKTAERKSVCLAFSFSLKTLPSSFTATVEPTLHFTARHRQFSTVGLIITDKKGVNDEVALDSLDWVCCLLTQTRQSPTHTFHHCNQKEREKE